MIRKKERKTDIEQQGRREYVMKSERGIKPKFIEKREVLYCTFIYNYE